MRVNRGFSMVEMAIVLVIFSLVIFGSLQAFSSIQEQKSYDDTNRRLNAAAEAILAFAIVNKRLPCPAAPNTTGVEVLATGTAATGGTCANTFSGFVPAQTVGVQPTSTTGYLVDAWQNPIRYAIAGSVALTGCTGSSTTPQFTSVANLKANGISCKPGITDLDICTTSTGISANSCNTATRVTNQSTVGFIVFSTGKNGAVTASYGTDELANTNGDNVFVYRQQVAAYDDLMVFVPAAVIYQRLIAAGVLP
jgi:prepilin-type N-terminal cleavage/methylation domain-containing protein